jgi:hypothetical protein
MGNNDENEIIDLDLSVTRKKRFRINGDNNCILELNTSDLNVITRLEEKYGQLKSLENEVLDLQTTETDESEDILETVATKLKSIDTQMRECVDYIFDADVSEKCAGNGSMYDPFNGKYRCEHIIDSILALYENNLKSEADKLKKRVETRTAKYTKKKVSK